MYLDANNLYEWPMSQKPPANGFEWVEDLSQFKENFIKNYDENSNKGYFLEVHVEYSKKLFNSERENRKMQKAYLQHTSQRKLCCSNKSLKTSIESWINTKNITKSNSI